MTPSNCVIRLSVLLVISLVQLTTSQRLQNSKEVALLKQMQDWGKGVYRAIEQKTDLHSEGQYLVAALVSDVQAVSPNTFYKNLLDGCPLKPDEQNKIMECRTSAVILNLESERIWDESEWRDNRKYQHHSWHGEYRLLHNGIINSMLRNFRHEKGDNATCHLLLYSFYIPCADIPGAPYSCSELISDYNNRNDTDCKVYITGYTKVFRRNDEIKTNRTKAESLLNACQKLKDINTKTKLVALKEIRSETNATLEVFQTKMYSCIMDSPLSGCCVDTEDNESQRIKVVSFFVNSLITEAVVANQFSLDKRTIKKNIKKLLETKIGIDCAICSYNSKVAGLYHRYLLDFCSQTALDLSDAFGKPVGGLLSGQWEKLNRTGVESDWKSTHNFASKIFCGRPHRGRLDPSSLCTKNASTQTDRHSVNVSKKNSSLKSKVKNTLFSLQQYFFLSDCFIRQVKNLKSIQKSNQITKEFFFSSTIRRTVRAIPVTLSSASAFTPWLRFYMKGLFL